MDSNPMTDEINKMNTDEIGLSRLKFNLKKKRWFWIGFLVTFSLLFIFNGVHLTTTTFIFAPLFSISVGYCLWSIRRLILCTRFLKPWIKNKPETSLSELLTSQAFKTTRRCLHQFSLSVGFVIFAAIAFLADPSWYLFDHLFLLTIVSGIVYGFCLLFAHAHVAAVIDYPIIRCLSAFKPVSHTIDFPEPPAYDHVPNPNPDPAKELEMVNKRVWETWMHDPMNPASAEYHLWKRP